MKRPAQNAYLPTARRLRHGIGNPRGNDTLPGTHGQRGLTLISLMIAGVLVALLALVVMKVVPTVIEFTAIKKAVVKAASASPTGNPLEIKNAFDRAQAIDDFDAVKASDLKIVKQGDKTVVSFAYEKKIQLAGPVSLLIEYVGSSRQ